MKLRKFLVGKFQWKIWRRFVTSSFIFLFLFQLFTVNVLAETIDLTEVTGDTLLPPGYVYPCFSPTVDNSSTNTVVLYDVARDLFAVVSFNGHLTFRNNANMSFHADFSQGTIVEFRYYECKGREVFTFTPEHQYTITVPQRMVEFTANPSYVKVTGTVQGDPRSFDTYKFIYDPKGNISSIVPLYNYGTEIFDYNLTMTMPNFKATLAKYNVSVNVPDLSSQSIDYYNVPWNSAYTTTIDYPAFYSLKNGILQVGNAPLNFIPVSMRLSVTHSLISMEGAKYSIYAYASFAELRNAELVKDYARLPLSVLNRYLSHFGYSEMFFSDAMGEVNTGLGEVGSELGGSFEAVGDLGGLGDEVLGNVMGDVASANTIFFKVWAIFPVWLWSIVIFGLVMVVIRKVMGR